MQSKQSGIMVDQRTEPKTLLTVAYGEQPHGDISLGLLDLLDPEWVERYDQLLASLK